MSPKKSDGKHASRSFEEALKRLEEIVELMEQGNVPLDEVMKMYEEGVAISKECLEQLNNAELKLKRLAKDIDGNFELLDGIDE